jgi:hypothetical protein
MRVVDCDGELTFSGLLHDLGSLSLGLKMPWLAHIEGEVDWVDAHVEQSLNASGVLGRLLQAG